MRKLSPLVDFFRGAQRENRVPERNLASVYGGAQRTPLRFWPLREDLPEEEQRKQPVNRDDQETTQAR